MGVQAAAVTASRRYRSAKPAEIISEFVELLSLPNVSRKLDDVAHVAEHIVGMLRSRGVDARVVTQPGAAPLVVGHLRTKNATSTIGIYAHYDGQPTDQPDWTTEPFTPTLFDGPIGDGAGEVPIPGSDGVVDPEWRLYARSASDDKAPILAAVVALDAMRVADVSPPNNVIFVFEGEEEIGSPHLSGYLWQLREELAEADVWLVCDGPVHHTRRPQVVFGVRGIAELEMTAYGPLRPLHSGHYGNWARNPNFELAALIASMKDEDRNVVVADFYADTQQITAADRAAVAALPDDDGALRHELGLADSEAAGEALALRLLRPSLNVRGFDGGAVGGRAANVIPTRARASIDLRLAAGDDPMTMAQRVADHARVQGWTVVTEEPDLEVLRSRARVIRIDTKANYPGVRLPTESPLAEALVAAASVAAGEPAISVPTFGGSAPLHHFTSVLGAPIAITPFANHDNNQHAADENIRVANLWYGIDLLAALMALTVPPRQPIAEQPPSVVV